MIGAVRYGSGFGGLVRYLTGDDRGEDDRAAWIGFRNLVTDDPELVALEMRATAEQNRRVEKPVYHLSLSAAPGERFDREQWEQIAGRVLKELGLEEHQALLVAHDDKNHQHIHLVVNRVHAETLRAWDPFRDYPKIEKALREIERDFGLREVPGHHYRLPEHARPERGEERTSGERRQAERSGEVVEFDRIQGQARPILTQAKSWAELEARLGKKGLRIEAKGRGLVVTDGAREVKASRIAREASRGHLEKRLGMEFQKWRSLRRDLEHTAQRLETLQNRDIRLSHIETAARQQAGKAGVIFDTVRMARREQAFTVERLRRMLGHLYGPEQIRPAGWKLARAVYREGWKRAIEDLQRRPERFGKLRGGPLRKLGLGREAKELRFQAADALWQVQRARLELRSLQPQLQQARKIFAPATRRAQRAVLASRRLPNHQPLELRLARLTLRLGFEAASFVLNPSALKLARIAVHAIELGRGLEREMERGR